MSKDDEVMTPEQAADFLKVKPSVLAKMRRTTRTDGPKYSRVGKAARYLRSDLVAYLQQNKG